MSFFTSMQRPKILSQCREFFVNFESLRQDLHCLAYTVNLEEVLSPSIINFRQRQFYLIFLSREEKYILNEL